MGNMTCPDGHACAGRYWQHSLCPGGQVCGGHGHRGGRRHGHPSDLGSQEEEPGKPEKQVKHIYLSCLRD
jgi:hypothetical protein